MKVLIAEDDSFFQHFYATKLEQQKFEVMVASDGQEALQRLQKFIPDIILLDLIMPKIDGFGVLIELKKNPTLQAIPVLVFSTLGQEKDIEQAKNLGASGYINKSYFDFNNLLATINTLVDSKKQQNQ